MLFSFRANGICFTNMYIIEPIPKPSLKSRTPTLTQAKIYIYLIIFISIFIFYITFFNMVTL